MAGGELQTYHKIKMRLLWLIVIRGFPLMNENKKWFVGIGVVSMFWTMAAVGLELAVGRYLTPEVDSHSIEDQGKKDLSCTKIQSPGIVVEVVDGRSGKALSCGLDLTLLSKNGEYQEALRPFLFGVEHHDENHGTTMTGTQPLEEQCPPVVAFAGAFERVDTYDLIIQKEGYKPWSRKGLAVKAGECHVSQKRLTAKLQKVVAQG